MGGEWPYGEDCLVHAVGMTGENFLVRVKPQPKAHKRGCKKHELHGGKGCAAKHEGEECKHGECKHEQCGECKKGNCKNCVHEGGSGEWAAGNGAGVFGGVGGEFSICFMKNWKLGSGKCNCFTSNYENLRWQWVFSESSVYS